MKNEQSNFRFNPDIKELLRHLALQRRKSMKEIIEALVIEEARREVEKND